MFFKVRSAIAASLFCFGVVAHAQTWPDQTVKIVVAYPAGSTMDTVARLIAPSLQSQLGHPFIVENRPGAGGRIGAEYVSHSKADGYTLFISGNSTHSANPSLYKNLPYDPIKDFTQIMRLTTIPYALVVSPKIQARTLADFAASGRANGGKFNYAYGSPAAQVAAVTLTSIEKFKATGVPYKGQPPAITDLLGGQVDFLVADLPVIVPQVRAGRLRALAILSSQRSPLLPDVPTMAEAGVSGYDLVAWIGLSGPAGMPSNVVSTLSTALAKTLVQPKVSAQLTQLGMEYTPNTPTEFNDFVKAQLAVWSRRVHDAGIQPE